MSGLNLALRRAELRDSEVVLSWRNDPASVSQSKSGKLVDPEIHKTWFRREISLPSSFLLIAELVGQGESIAIGMCRFRRREEGDFEVSINLAPECRGKSWGQKVLESGIEFVKLVAEPHPQFTATVNLENIGSKKIFERAGFIVVEERDSWLYLKLRL